MPQISPFEAYGAFVNDCTDTTQLAGRYFCQKQDERNIVADLTLKLKLNSLDDCLEIGCGPGSLLIPLSFTVNSIVGIDHKNVIKQLAKRYQADNIKFVSGDFLSIDKNALGHFDKIIIYSVLHCLKKMQEVESLIDSALALLNPGGRLLLGDIPNSDKKQRFSNSKVGKAFEKKWQQKLNATNTDQENTSQKLYNVHPAISFNDHNINHLLLYIRKKNYESFLLPQADNLPFCFTREDILVLKP